MDAVTYPDSQVVAELDEHWLEARIDVSEEKGIADLFGVAAIPTAIAAIGDGRVLGRIVGFVEPTVFHEELARLRESR